MRWFKNGGVERGVAAPSIGEVTLPELFWTFFKKKWCANPPKNQNWGSSLGLNKSKWCQPQYGGFLRDKGSKVRSQKHCANTHSKFNISWLLKCESPLRQTEFWVRVMGKIPFLIRNDHWKVRKIQWLWNIEGGGENTHQRELTGGKCSQSTVKKHTSQMATPDAALGTVMSGSRVHCREEVPKIDGRTSKRLENFIRVDNFRLGLTSLSNPNASLMVWFRID